MSNQAELAVELSASYAHRVGDDLHVVVQLAEQPALDAPVQLQLRAGKRLAQVPATATLAPDGTLYDATVAAGELRPGVWRLALVDAHENVRPVQARLLNSTKQPVALLPGPVPRTELPAPRPAEPSASVGKQRAYAAASKIANRGLALLPDPQADKARSLLKKAGQRVLS